MSVPHIIIKERSISKVIFDVPVIKNQINNIVALKAHGTAIIKTNLVNKLTILYSFIINPPFGDIISYQYFF